ncbi:hypothetical protein [Paractinoplanes ovalisporus]|uniref:hypothetical protein n=1 Tax=Paractinoplanes ovalisporus TaxID=2810368 RepID=UPI0034DADE5C
MARIPLAERVFGQDRLARWHRWTGFVSFWLMIGHIGLITLGYGGTSGTGAVAELWAMIRNSLSADPRGQHLRITVKNLGDASGRVAGAAARHPGADRGPVRETHRRELRRRAGRDAGLRDRRDPAAGPARRDAVRAGPGHPRLPGALRG